MFGIDTNVILENFPDGSAKTSAVERKIFRSFLSGGFECSTQRDRNGRRLDLLAATQHDRLASRDYSLLRSHGIQTARDGVRWHLIENFAGYYDSASFLPMLRAANANGMQIVWDLCHYGWPDHIDIWSSAFVDHFARFSAAIASIVATESDAIPFYCPINEVSFWAWASGTASYFFPLALGRADELKRQLTRATIASIEAIRSVDATARFVHADPLTHIAPKSHNLDDQATAERARNAQNEARDMLIGALQPELGGRPDYLDIMGVNYYPHNQWVLEGPTIPFGTPYYRRLSDLLCETYLRYEKPMFIAETGAEGGSRAAWLFYVCDEVRSAAKAGAPVHGVCLYPVLDYPGWENDRICEAGLLSVPDDEGHRYACASLAEELDRQQILFKAQQVGD